MKNALSVMNYANRLRALYQEHGKHAGYQALPEILRSRLALPLGACNSRYEDDRMRFIDAALDFRNRTVRDVGANAGYFSFTAASRGAAKVVAHEGSPALAQFIQLAADWLGLANQVEVAEGYFDATLDNKVQPSDIVILMNVLHHFGDDYGNPKANLSQAREQIAESIRAMAFMAKYMVLQLGYCWKGNPRLGLFPNGTKAEQLKFVQRAALGNWEIVAVGIAERGDGESIEYRSPTQENMRRDDTLGEFLNRPLFVLESRQNTSSCPP